MIIHAGFHKTGTTTVQNMLKAQHAFLSPHVCVILKSDIRDLCEAALAFSTHPSKAQLTTFRAHAASCFGDMPDDDQRPILISAEDLSGAIPGRRGRPGYPHAKPLLTALVSELAPNITPHVYFSTRAPALWLKSCYAHNLRHSRLRQSQDDFIKKYAGHVLDDIAQDIALALNDVPVTTAPLEDTSAHAQGPLTPILDLLDLPHALREPLRPTAITNRSLPPDILEGLLKLNREVDDGIKRSDAKTKLIADYQRRTQ